MNRKQFILSLMITFLIFGFMLFSPKYIAENRSVLTMQRNNENDEVYQGIITVWHIVGFKPYKGSLGSWLCDAASQLEKQHNGVFFEVDSITMDEYTARMERGEQPDVFSFPLGSIYVEQLKALDADYPLFRGNLSAAGQREEKLYGVPYAVSGYLICCNQRLIQELGTDSVSILSMIKDGTVKASGNAVMACLWESKGELLSEEDFLGEKSAAAFVDARAVGDIERKVQNGKGFPYEVISCSNYTDLVQLIGANVNIEAEKIPYVYEFIDTCLNKKNQTKLMNIGLMPAVMDIEPEKAENEALKILFDQLNEPVVSNTFLYGTYRGQLEISAREAMNGSNSAKKDFDLRLTELTLGGRIK